MASLTKDGRLMFVTDDGKRRSIRLTKLAKRQRQEVLRHVELLVSSRTTGSAPPDETSRWVAGIGEKLRDKLVNAGLIRPKESTRGYSLAQLMEDYEARPKWKTNKPSTRQNNLDAFRRLISHFGEDQPVRSVAVADAADFYDAMRLGKEDGGMGLSVASSNLYGKISHALFNYAIDSEALDRNPFRDIPKGTRSGNNVTVPVDVSMKVQAAMPGTEERLLFGVSRWGGLRVPSEARLLRWCDIDWEKNRFLVHSPKTERHEGHETRWVPIWDELAPLFDARYTEAAEGDDYVLPILRGRSKSGGDYMLKKAIKLAGVDRWPRLWHSMRSTRQTELVVLTKNPSLVCKWLGNSRAVAEKHYEKFTDEHEADAVAKVRKNGAKMAQHPQARSGIAAQTC